MKKNKTIYTLMISISVLMFSCQGLVDDINDDPNSIPTEDIEQQLFLTGAQLANISFQAGHFVNDHAGRLIEDFFKISSFPKKFFSQPLCRQLNGR